MFNLANNRLQRYWEFNLGFLQKLGLLFAFASGGLICISGVAINTTNQLVETDRWVIHTYEVLAQFELINSKIKDTERGQRGYLLTQDARFLTPYEQSVGEVYTEIEELKILVSDNPGQVANAESLRFFADERILLIKLTLDLARQGKQEEAIAQVKKGEGFRAMQQVQEIVNRGKQQEEQLLKIRMEASAAAVRSQRWATGALIFFVAVILVGAYQSVNREVDRRRKAEIEALEAKEQATAEREKLMYVMREGVGLAEIQDGIRRNEDRGKLFEEIDRLIAETRRN